VVPAVLTPATPKKETAVPKFSLILASLVAAGSFAGSASAEEHWDAHWMPPSVDPSRIIHAAGRWDLQSNTTQTYTLNIVGLGQDYNLLLPCFGFDIHGGGTDLDVANPRAFGPVRSNPDAITPPDSPPAPDGVRHIGDGGIPGAQRQPDGTYAIPESLAVVDPVNLHEGASCAAAGWHWYDEHGAPTNVALPNYAKNPAAVADTDAIENVAMATTAKARAAARRKAKAKNKSSKAKKKVRPAKSAQVAGAVTVDVAGFTGFPDTPDNPERLVVRVTTGQLSGPATLRLRADVLKQPSVNVPENR
jgi:hypothetical protein